MAPHRPVPSPCIDICEIDPESGLCVGCLRNGHEITVWAAADDDLKRTILRRVERRRTALARGEATGRSRRRNRTREPLGL